jgi:hypothetical protein
VIHGRFEFLYLVVHEGRATADAWSEEVIPFVDGDPDATARIRNARARAAQRQRERASRGSRRPYAAPAHRASRAAPAPAPAPAYVAPAYVARPQQAYSAPRGSWNGPGRGAGRGSLQFTQNPTI